MAILFGQRVPATPLAADYLSGFFEQDASYRIAGCCCLLVVPVLFIVGLRLTFVLIGWYRSTPPPPPPDTPPKRDPGAP